MLRAIVLLSAVCLCSSSRAWANGRFPRADQLVAVPGQPERLVLRTTFGLLFSHDAGQSWDWLCEQAVGFVRQEDPAVAALADGSVLAGLSAGLARSSDQGCSWRFADLSPANLEIVDLSVRPLEPASAVALGWERVDGGNAFGYSSRFLYTLDAGVTWQSYGTGIDSGVLVLTLDVAASDPQRLYASGIRPAARAAALYVSSDDAQTWSERPIPFDTPREQGVYIAAVDPLVPERVYLRTSGAASSRLFVTDDAGATYEELFSGRPLLGFALSPDGADIYAGGLEDGLWVATRTGRVFEQRSALPIQCLLHTANTLYACSNELTGFALGASTDGGREFIAKLHLSEVRGPLACPAESAGGLCAAQWPGIAERLAISAEPMAPSNPSTPDGGGPAPAGSAPASGCSVEPGGGDRGSGPASCLTLLAMVGFCAARPRLSPLYGGAKARYCRGSALEVTNVGECLDPSSKPAGGIHLATVNR